MASENTEINRDWLIKTFLNVRKHSKNGSRAPHKPLVLLFALSTLRQSSKRFLKFEQYKEVVGDLLETYGRSVKGKQHPEFPFWRLQSDDIWECTNTSEVKVNQNGDVSANSLLKYKVEGGFTEKIYNYLLQNPDVINEAIIAITEDNFPPSTWSDIYAKIGFDSESLMGNFQLTKRKTRDPRFPRSVLRAYEFKCAICKFDARLDRVEFGIEAAHIRWHAYDGPDSVNNGLALCSIHHKALDRGAISFDEEFRLKISPQLNSQSDIALRLFKKFDGQTLYLPREKSSWPSPIFIKWHYKEVFKKY